MSVVGGISSVMRGMENRINTALTLTGQSLDVGVMVGALKRDALAHTELSSVARALDSGPSVRDSLLGARQALRESAAANDVRLGATRVSSGSGGAARAAESGGSPVGIVDGHPTDVLGNTPRGYDRGVVGPDGQGFDSLGGAVGGRGHEDYSDVVLF